MQSRWRSKAAWIATAAVIGFIATEWFHVPIPGWNQFVDLVVIAAAAWGIFNNPTNPDGY
jgi:hypothetical protein